MKITDRHLKMLDPRGFDSIFEQERLNYDTDTECFQALNREYKQAFGRKRYKSFKSYHSTRWERVRS